MNQERDRKDVTARETKETRKREEEVMGTKFKEEFGDDISELRLDGDPEGGGGGEQEAKIVTGARIQPVSETAAEMEDQGEDRRQGWRVRTRGGKGRDYCTSEERRRVEEWIAGCERADCKGFVKTLRGGSGGDSSGGHSSADGDGNENKIESGVRVRGGCLAPGWRELGSGWGANKFMI